MTLQDGDRAEVYNMARADPSSSQDSATQVYSGSLTVTEQGDDRATIANLTSTTTSTDSVTGTEVTQQERHTAGVDNLTTADVENTQDCVTANSGSVPETEMMQEERERTNVDIMTRADPENTQDSVTHNSDKASEKSNSKIRTFTCHVCDKSFPIMARLKKHLRMHERRNDPDYLSSRPWCCSYPQCNSRFKREEYLANHIQALHLKQYSIRCAICQQGFNRDFFLQRHMRKTHPGAWEKVRHDQDSDMVCNICGIIFKTKKILRKHMGRHEKTHDIIRENGKCICENNSGGSMQRCIKAWGTKGDDCTQIDDLRCTLCGIITKTKKILKVHMKRHEKIHCTIKENGQCQCKDDTDGSMQRCLEAWGTNKNT